MRLLRTSLLRSSKCGVATCRLHDDNCVFSLGPVDASTVAKVIKEVSEEDKRRQKYIEARPSIDTIVNLHDFEVRNLLSCTMSRAHNPRRTWPATSSRRRHGYVIVLRLDNTSRPTSLDRHITLPHLTTKSLCVRTAWHINGEPIPQWCTARGLSFGYSTAFGSARESFGMSPKSTGRR